MTLLSSCCWWIWTTKQIPKSAPQQRVQHLSDEPDLSSSNNGSGEAKMELTGDACTLMLL